MFPPSIYFWRFWTRLQKPKKFSAVSDRERRRFKNFVRHKKVQRSGCGRAEEVRIFEKYARNLTSLAKEDKLDPVIGRDSEIKRLMQIINRRTKNNPILIGKPA